MPWLLLKFDPAVSGTVVSAAEEQDTVRHSEKHISADKDFFSIGEPPLHEYSTLLRGHLICNIVIACIRSKQREY